MTKRHATEQEQGGGDRVTTHNTAGPAGSDVRARGRRHRGRGTGRGRPVPWLSLLTAGAVCAAAVNAGALLAGTTAAAAAGVDRAVMAVVVTRALHLAPENVGPPYADVGAAWPASVREAIETGADADLWGPWVPGARFAPHAPATLGAVLTALLTGLGYGQVAADLPDGTVRVARAFGLLPPGAASLRAPVTRQELAWLVHRVPASPPPAAVRLAVRTVRRVTFQYGLTTVGAGSATWVLVTPQDALGYTVPVPYTAHASAGQFDAPEATYVAPSRVPAGGASVTLTARVGTLTGHLTLRVVPVSGLAFVPGVPTAYAAGAALNVTGAVVSDGAAFAGDNGRTVTLSVVGPGGRRWAQSVEDQTGLAPFHVVLPDAPGREVTLVLSSPGMASVRARLLLTRHLPPGPRLVPVNARSARGTVPLGSALAWQVRPGAGWPSGVVLPRPVVRVAGPLKALRVRPGRGQRVWTVSAVAGPYGGTASVTAALPGIPADATDVVRVEASPGPMPACLTAHAGGALAVQMPRNGVPVHLVWEGPIGQEGQGTGRPGARIVLAHRVTVAGIYRVTAFAQGREAMVAACTVAPGPIARLAVHVTPSPFLRPGQTARIWAAWVDAWGNPVQPAMPLDVQGTGAVQVKGTAGEATVGGGRDVARVSAMRVGAGWVRVTAVPPGGGRPTMAARPVTVLASAASLFALPGMWLPYWIWQATPATTLFRQARAAGIRVIYLEVATSANGVYGTPALVRFVAAAHSRGLAVVPWVYADLADPAVDLANARAVLGYVAPDGTRPDGFASDLEGNAALPAWAVAPFLASLRALIGRAGPLLVATYPPGGLAPPYGLVARYASALAPMDYWHGNPVTMGYQAAYEAVRTSVTAMHAAAPDAVVVPILEAFDMFTPSGRGVYSPTPAELAGAVAAVRASGGQGFTFYQWGTVTPGEWAIVRDADRDALP